MQVHHRKCFNPYSFLTVKIFINSSQRSHNEYTYLKFVLDLAIRFTRNNFEFHLDSFLHCESRRTCSKAKSNQYHCKPYIKELIA